MRHWLVIALMSLSSFAVSQQKSSNEELPKLQHLSADQVNPQIDPCTDFYQYSAANFLPPTPFRPTGHRGE